MRDTRLVSKILPKDLGLQLEKLGESNIMTRAILQHIQAWRSKPTPILCISDKSKNERELNIAIRDQSRLGWHLFLRGMHARS